MTDTPNPAPEETNDTPANSGGQTTPPSSTDAKGAGGKAPAPAGGAVKATEKPAEDAPWYQGLPGDLTAEKSLLRHASLEDAMRALVGAEKRLGVPHDQLIRLPTKDEEFADVYRKLGAPETAEGYKIELPENATEEDKAVAARFADAMFKAGPFPPAVVKAAIDFINGETTAADEALSKAQEKRRAEGVAFLKKELGAAYDPDMKAIGKMLNDLGGEELAAELDATGMGDNPRLMLALHKVLERVSEPGTLDGQGRAMEAAKLSQGQARAALANLEADPVKGKALLDNSHSMHKTVLAERTRLARMAEGLDPDA